MTRKKVEAVETIHPHEAMLKNWWVRAVISFVLGVFFAMLASQSLLGVIFGIAGVLLAIIFPVVCVINALHKESRR